MSSSSQCAPKHFLSLLDLSSQALAHIISRASELKAMRNQGVMHEPMRGKVLGMIFAKPSTRTRISFEAGMAQMGGHAIFLSPQDTQMGRGEPIEDTAKVVSRMVDIVMIRNDDHQQLQTFAQHSKVPVINALTDLYHPCQLLADVQTFVEHRGAIMGKTVAWVGDGNNMCHSYINAARQFNFKLRIACPQGYYPNADIMSANREYITLVDTPEQAVSGAHLVVTDTWASMGHEADKQARLNAFKGYQVNSALLDLAVPEVLFMHCLPAYRGLEISVDLFDDPRSVVFDEAENRLHAQKALMEFLLQ